MSDMRAFIQEIINQNSPLQARQIASIAKDCADFGAQVYIVGGSVRDFFLSLPVKDIDIEVHGIDGERLAQILARYGVVDYVGKSFGVFRIHGIDIDWSLPRKDKSGRKPIVEIDPYMALKEAFRRRDLTINAMGVNVMTGELVDPFHGLDDLRNGILRSPDISLFAEDPLRFFRVMQFIARFAMYPDDQLNALCATMDIAAVSQERIAAEFEKMFLRSTRPSLGIRWLAAIGRLQEILPELYACINIQQNPAYHPEGDVFEHSMQALDEAARLRYDSKEEKLLILWAALCHDLGKATTTTIDADGRIHSYGHEKESALYAQRMLKRIINKRELILAIVKLVLHHMDVLSFIKNGATASAYKRLAQKLYPHVTIAMLCKLVQADKNGRTKDGQNVKEKHEDLEQFIRNARAYGVFYHREEPLLKGRDLLAEFGAGPHLGRLLKEAYAMQIKKNMQDKDQLKRFLLEKYKTVESI